MNRVFPSEIIIVPAVFGVFGVVAVTKMRLKHREYMASLRPPAEGGEHDARMARLESAVEAIAVEVERIGEGQRFVTRLLAERGSAPVAEGTARSAT